MAEENGKGRAIASMVLGIVGFFMFMFSFIPGIIALSLGCSARGSMKRSNNYTCSGMAICGIVLGIIDIIIGCLLWISFFIGLKIS